MAEGRRRHDWDQTAELLALLANVHRDTKKRPRPYPSSWFHPLRSANSPSSPRGLPLTADMIGLLGDALGAREVS
ncbi:MAG: hypothetical protein AAGG38_13475 [Planctomycetota bacterium]